MGILPTAPHRPQTSMSAYAWLVYGPPKIGKTTFANGWPRALFVATEPGTAAMTASDICVASWTDFEGVLYALETERNEYRTIVIDTIDNLWEMLTDDICTTNGWQDLGDGGYGKGYKLARRKLITAIARLRRLPQAILFISHERKDVDEKTKVISVTSQLPGSARKVLHGEVDFILRAELGDDDRRILRTQPYRDDRTEVECGSRGIPERPMADLIGLDFDSLHAAFREAFPPHKTAEEAQETR